MSYDYETLRRIYRKTNGRCRYCGKKLAWKNYGRPWARAAWEVDHSIPISRGGTDHLNNLFPACIRCNREKRDMTGTEFKRYLKRKYGI